MTNLVLHPATRKAIQYYLASPTHAVLLIGPTGIGKSSLATHIGATLLHLSKEKFDSYPYLNRTLPLDGKAISIEAIRQLQQFMTLRIPSQASGIHRIAIIENGQLLTTEAQNALLKTLEEPPADTVLIITSASAEALLPTVLSRLRQVPVISPAIGDLQHFFAVQRFSDSEIQKAISLSGGLPGLMQALLTEPTSHPLYKATAQAREILNAGLYDRLTLIDSLVKDKQLSLDVLFILGQMAHVALQKTDTMAAKSVSRWQSVLRQSYVCQEKLRRNAQSKLVLTDLMLSI